VTGATVTFAKTYTRANIVQLLKNRARSFARMLDDYDIDDIISTCMRKLDESVNAPRDLVISSYARSVDLTAYNVDEICAIYFSDNQGMSASPVGAEVGLMPFIMRGAGMGNFTNVIEFLQMKATLNIMNRQLRTAPDYEYKGGTIYFNRPYAMVDIEFLPYLDASAVEWDLYQLEYHYFFERCWCEMNLRNAEAQMSATVLGIGEKATPVADHWTTKIDKLDLEWLDKGAISYVG
jgi:hypothetical protein